ncbi:MAG: hypothetical protein CMJ49_09690 [Planctomycetaceae bacterium]|nr:hypothetical protein [Planctomycetaceae bacterium]
MTDRESSSNVNIPAEDTVDAAVEPAPPPRRPAGLPAHLSLPRQVFALALWPFLDALMVFLVGMVDTVLAGHDTPATMNAIGGAGYLIWLMGLLQGAVGIGATALIARAFGAGRTDEANHAAGQAVLLALIWGLINALLFWYIIAPYAGRLVNLQGQALADCETYLRILALAAPCRAVLFLCAASLRGAGDTRSPFFVMVAVNFVNIVVSVALVVPWSPIGGHGIAGIAWGTNAAWAVGCVIIILLLMVGPTRIRLTFAAMRPNKPMLGRLIRIGGPSLAENIGHWGVNYLVLLTVGYLVRIQGNQDLVGAHMIAIRIEAICFMACYAIGIAAATLIGQYLGAGDPRRAKQAGWICLAGAIAISLFFSVIFITIPEILVRIATDKPAFHDIAPRLLFIIAWSQVGFAAYLVLGGALRGAGDVRWSMLMVFATSILCRLPLVWLFGVTLGGGINGIWFAMALELIVRGIVFGARFMHGGWTRQKV